MFTGTFFRSYSINNLTNFIHLGINCFFFSIVSVVFGRLQPNVLIDSVKLLAGVEMLLNNLINKGHPND